MPDALKTPVAFIIFNRPKCTRRVFAEIRKARPEKLYLVADGPRPHKEGEAERCAETRQLVENMIDWPCAVRKDYADQNMGCRWRVASGITKVFEQEEAAIILEDDCLPSQSFFTFCAEMLVRYKDEPRIMQICGTNKLSYKPSGSASYFFSRYAPIWGWATWRRSWELYDQKMQYWDMIKQDSLLYRVCLSKREAATRELALDSIKNNMLDTWDYVWVLTILINRGMAIVPRENLIKNIGFGSEATHTNNPLNILRFHPLRELNKPLIHHPVLRYDERHDVLYHRKHYGPLSINALKTLIVRKWRHK